VNLPFALVLFAVAPSATEPADGSNPDGAKDYGPFFEDEAPSDASFATRGRKTRAPTLSVGGGAFCFVEDSWCKASLLASAEVAAGMRVPASDKGPDMPYAHFGFRGGFTLRPMMFSRRQWHPWGIGAVASWTRGTGATTVEGGLEDQTVDETPRTDSLRVGLLNQVWLSRKPHAFHLDFTLGVVRSEVLTTGRSLVGTHTEVAFGFGGWGSVFASGDFLDQDARISFGLRGHAIAAGPILAMAIAGLALGGAL
jgi:hypothetical protein